MSLPPLVAVEVRTRYLPPLVLDVDDPRAPPTPPGQGSRLMAWLRPRLTVTSPFGTQTSAPWGEPGPTRWPLVRVVLAGAALGVLALACVGAAALLRSRRTRG